MATSTPAARASPPPPSARRAGRRSVRRRRPLRGQAALEGQRSRVLRQVALELLGEQPLGHLLVGAVGTPLEMRAQGRRRGRIEPAALIVEEVEPRRLAVHVPRHRA